MCKGRAGEGEARDGGSRVMGMSRPLRGHSARLNVKRRVRNEV